METPSSLDKNQDIKTTLASLHEEYENVFQRLKNTIQKTEEQNRSVRRLSDIGNNLASIVSMNLELFEMQFRKKTDTDEDLKKDFSSIKTALKQLTDYLNLLERSPQAYEEETNPGAAEVAHLERISHGEYVEQLVRRFGAA